jgi:hypothetical protein
MKATFTGVGVAGTEEVLVAGLPVSGSAGARDVHAPNSIDTARMVDTRCDLRAM